MFVYNTVWRDRRVLKEANSLVRDGWFVTVIGLSLGRDPQPLHEVTPDGVVIRRVPLSLAVPAWRRKRSASNLVRRLVARRRRLAHQWSSGMQRIRRRGWSLLRPSVWRPLMRRLAANGPWSARPSRSRRLAFSTRRAAHAVRAAPRVVGQAGLFAWLALYSGIDRLAGGELDWLLNATDRWEEFARRAAALAPPATVYHGHDLSGIGAAIRSRDRHGQGAIVYDVHDLYVESGTLARSSRALKFILHRREAAAWHRADAHLTVNASLAAELQRRYGERDVALVHNCVAVTPPGGRHLLRTALSLTSADRVALYQGALTEVRGLRQLVAAMDEPGLEKVHLAFMGFGPMLDELQWLSTAHPRIHVLPPVTHDDLDAWIAGADVCVMPNQPAGINERLSTPNKLFESIAAGVPVVTSNFPERRAIVLDPDLGPLGAVCEPTRPASIAAAMRAVLDLDAEAATAMRARCRAAASVRWNWSEQERTLLETYQRVAGRPDGSDEHAPRGSMRAA